MGRLHPEPSRRRRIENVISGAVFVFVLLAMTVSLVVASPTWNWWSVLSAAAIPLLALLVGAYRAIKYIHGDKR